MTDILYGAVLWLLGFLAAIPVLLIGLVFLAVCLSSVDERRSRRRLAHAHCRNCGAQFGWETVRRAEKSLQERAEEIESAHPDCYVNYRLYLELCCRGCGEVSRRKP